MRKKLTEQLDAYYRLWQIAEPGEKEALLARIREVVAVTYEPRYHDLGSTTDRWFKQDATSYLRAAVPMERLGLDTRLYRAEIAKITTVVVLDALTVALHEPWNRDVFPGCAG